MERTRSAMSQVPETLTRGTRHKTRQGDWMDSEGLVVGRAVHPRSSSPISRLPHRRACRLADTLLKVGEERSHKMSRRLKGWQRECCFVPQSRRWHSRFGAANECNRLKLIMQLGKASLINGD